MPSADSANIIVGAAAIAVITVTIAVIIYCVSHQQLAESNHTASQPTKVLRRIPVSLAVHIRIPFLALLNHGVQCTSKHCQCTSAGIGENCHYILQGSGTGSGGGISSGSGCGSIGSASASAGAGASASAIEVGLASTTTGATTGSWGPGPQHHHRELSSDLDQKVLDELLCAKLQHLH
jgi:hypothetical protein